MVFALAAVLRLAAPALAQVEGQVIYGDDDRIDVYQTKDARLKKLADSTVALVRASSVRSAGGAMALDTEPYGESMGLCKDEPFYEQPTAAFCSGSLVAPDVIMTAGHCVTSEAACPGVKFVFGFAVKKKGEFPKTDAASDVYSCGKLLGREQVNDGSDWALIKLDRPVVGHEPLKLNLSRQIVNGTPLIVIGHPSGLPTKIAGGAAVRDASKDGYFVANLDTYGGNSGSAVFNGQNGNVEGILVRGENDFTYRGSCRVSNKCPADGCRGEDVTKLDHPLDRLSGAAHEDRVAGLSPTFAALLEKVGAVQSRP
jgi:hypothetical protein